MSAKKLVSYRGQKLTVIKTFQVQGQRFQVVRKLNSGPKEVYQVWDPSARQMRLLHILPHSKGAMNQLHVLRKVAEGNPEFLQIIHIKRQDSKVIAVLSWVEGNNLRSVIQRMRRSNPKKNRIVSAPEAIRLVKGLAHAVSRLHGKEGVIHGDIKPANLILTNRTGLVLIDYGSAWPIARTISRKTVDGYSPSYAAPEQVRGEVGVDHRADYFSICAVLYEILTCKVPYQGYGGNVGKLPASELKKLVLKPASEISPERNIVSRRIWRSADRLLVKGLSVDRDDRFENKHEWLAAWSDLISEVHHSHEHSFRKSAIGAIGEWVARLFWRA